MRIENRVHHSAALGQEMEYRVYGSGRGQPLVAFPSLNGRFHDLEGFEMIDALAHLLDADRLTLWTVDSVDWQSWTNQELPPADRVRRHADYDRYLSDELLPEVLRECGRDTLWVAGCSMGAYHAASAFFRHPHLADGLIAISGLYQPHMFIGDHSDELTRSFAPLLFLEDVTDTSLLDRYRRSRIVFCIGQGAWEEECLADTRAMEDLLRQKEIPATFDYWGHDVDHHWYWWRKMLPYHLQRLGV